MKKEKFCPKETVAEENAEGEEKETEVFIQNKVLFVLFVKSHSQEKICFLVEED